MAPACNSNALNAEAEESDTQGWTGPYSEVQVSLRDKSLSQKHRPLLFIVGNLHSHVHTATEIHTHD